MQPFNTSYLDSALMYSFIYFDFQSYYDMTPESQNSKAVERQEYSALKINRKTPHVVWLLIRPYPSCFPLALVSYWKGNMKSFVPTSWVILFHLTIGALCLSETIYCWNIHTKELLFELRRKNSTANTLIQPCLESFMFRLTTNWRTTECAFDKAWHRKKRFAFEKLEDIRSRLDSPSKVSTVIITWDKCVCRLF